MHDGPAAPTIDDLLVHAEFVRRTARALLGADPEVDDVAQDVWVKAMGRGPREPGALRAWLGRIAKNLALDRLRVGGRRRRREQAASRPESTPSAHEILAREEMRRRVITAVLALGEPSREAVVLRYYEGLSIAETAGRLKVPLETARTRLRRGLATLRERLDAEHGGQRASWAVALAPWAQSTLNDAVPVGSLDATATSVAIGVAAVAMLAIGGVVGGVLWLRAARESPDESLSSKNARELAASRLSSSPPPSAGPGAPPALAARPTGISSPSSSPSPVAVADTRQTGAVGERPAGDASVVRGVLVDPSGAPIGGSRLRINAAANASASVDVMTDADGRFASPTPIPFGRIVIELRSGVEGLVASADGGPAFVLASHEHTAAGEPVRIAFSWNGIVRGVVVTEDGAPVRGARLWLRGTDLAAMSMDPHHGLTETSDANGRFGFVRVPVDHPLALRVEADGFATLRTLPTRATPAGAAEVEETKVVVGPPLALAIRVQTADGRPVNDVDVYVNTAARGDTSLDVAERVSDGLFVAKGLARGAYRVSAARRFDTVASLERPYELREANQAPAELVIGPATPPRIQGVVSGPSGPYPSADELMYSVGFPIAWSYAVGGSQDGTFVGTPAPILADGSFTLAVDAGRRVRVVVKAGGLDRGSEPIETVAGDPPIHPIWRVPPGRVRAIVLGADKAPVVGATVDWFLGEPTPYEQAQDNAVRRDTTDAHGATAAVFASPGRVTALAIAMGHGMTRRSVEVHADGTTDLEIVLPEARTVRGVVVNAQRRPVRGVRVAPLLSRFAAWAPGAVRTDAEGRFDVGGLPPSGGKVALLADDESFPGLVDVADADAQPIVLVDTRAR